MPFPRFHVWEFAPLPSLLGGGIIVGLVAFGLMGGCSSLSSDRKPIPDSTFTRLLTDIHLTVARHEVEAPIPKGLRDSVLARYGVRPTEFDATLAYYSEHPQELKTLYQPIIDSLRALQFTRRPSSPRSPPDSVRRSKE